RFVHSGRENKGAECSDACSRLCLQNQRDAQLPISVRPHSHGLFPAANLPRDLGQELEHQRAWGHSSSTPTFSLSLNENARSRNDGYGPHLSSLATVSIQERHVSHRLRLTLRVHQDPVPAVQGDRGVVSVTDAALHVYARVAAHRSPTPSLRLRIARQDHLVLRLGDSVRVSRADVHRLAACPVTEFHPVRFAAATSGEWLVSQHQVLVHGDVCDRQEEPLTLANVCGILATVASLGPESLACLCK